jgi:hypothetical protein
VVPQPVVVGAAVPVRTHDGSLITMLSPTASAILRLKETATVVLAPAVGLASTIDVPEKPEAAAVPVAVDDAMEMGAMDLP